MSQIGSAGTTDSGQPINGVCITHERSEEGGRYVATIDGYQASLFYRERTEGAARVWEAYSTQVHKALAGRGIGLALVERLVRDARAQNGKIRPACSFVRLMFDRHDVWNDVYLGGEQT